MGLTLDADSDLYNNHWAFKNVQTMHAWHSKTQSAAVLCGVSDQEAQHIRKIEACVRAGIYHILGCTLVVGVRVFRLRQWDVDIDRWEFESETLQTQEEKKLQSVLKKVLSNE